MTIRARCPHCDDALEFPEASEGHESECPGCRGGLRVPPLLYYACIGCDHPYRSSLHHAMRTFVCLECHERVTVPKVSTRPAPRRSTAADAGPVDAPAIGGFGQGVDRAGFTGSDASAASFSSEPGDSTYDDWFEELPATGANTPGAPQFDTTSVVTSAAGSAAVVYAGFFRRLIAFLIDTAVLLVLFLIGGFALGFVVGVMTTDEASIATAALVGNLCSGIVGFVYFVSQESSHRRATFGKALLGLQVADLRGRRLSPLRAAARIFCRGVSFLLCGLGFAPIVFTERKQGLHDLIAGTCVEIPQ